MATPLTMQAQTNYDLDHMQMERLDRGLVAVRQSADSVMLSWRYLREDPMDTSEDFTAQTKRERLSPIWQRTWK